MKKIKFTKKTGCLGCLGVAALGVILITITGYFLAKHEIAQFERNRHDILSEATAAIERGDFYSVLALKEEYPFVEDSDLNQLLLSARRGIEDAEEARRSEPKPDPEIKTPSPLEQREALRSRLTQQDLEKAKRLMERTQTLYSDLLAARDEADESGWTEAAVREFSREIPRRHLELEQAVEKLAEKPIDPLFPIKLDLSNAVLRISTLKDYGPHGTKFAIEENKRLFQEEISSAEKALANLLREVESDQPSKTPKVLSIGIVGNLKKGTDIYESFDDLKASYDSFDHGDEKGAMIRKRLAEEGRVTKLTRETDAKILQIRQVSPDPLVTALKIDDPDDTEFRPVWILKNRFISSLESR